MGSYNNLFKNGVLLQRNDIPSGLDPNVQNQNVIFASDEVSEQKRKMGRRETISPKREECKTREMERTYRRRRSKSLRNDGESHPIVFSISHSTALSFSVCKYIFSLSLSLSDLCDQNKR